ncbi:MAG: hypothetical protein BGO43_14425 [Gammaproteobacteria bacterium 39-13]|nr:hypothetical protein [Gammaproteobacteria bacterium]OJV88489.1 MAG: hypothetical protein BGO43_14425 [Gammaproteobacteria bacterium 39-13]
MKQLNTNEIEQVSGAGLLSVANVFAGGLLGGAAASQIGAVAIAGVAVTAPYIVASGVILGATFGYAISQSAETPSYYYY